ncbi:MAG: rod shape-determining protein MreC, partial [Ilumatobacteraceae bacterium]
MNLSLSRRRVLALLALTSILLITLDLRGNSTIDAMKRGFSTVRSPMEDVGRAISRPVKNAWRGVTNYGELERENDRLRELVDQQQGEAIAAQVALRDYQELLAANQLTSLSQYSKVTAQVLAYAPQNFQQTVEINQGSKKGIRVGMPVVNAAGLVGKITSVTSDSAVVLLISDRNYSVTVKVVGDQPIPGTTAEAEAEANADGEGLLPSGSTVDSTAETTSSAPASVETTTPTTIPGDTSVASAVSETVETTTTVPPTTTTTPPTTTEFVVDPADAFVQTLVDPTASSTAPDGVDGAGNPVSYSVDNTVDGDYETAWRTEGDGVGETLTYHFAAGSVYVTSVGLIPGYAKIDATDGTDRFLENRRIRAVRWTFDGGVVQQQDFADSRDLQTIDIPGVLTRTITIEILETTDHGGRDFTPVSEVQVEGVVGEI